MRSMHLSEGRASGSYRVRVRVFGPLKEELGKEVLELDAHDDESILDLLRKLPEPLQRRVLEGGEVSPDLLILVDGVEVSCLGDPREVRLRGCREVHLVPVIHGG